MRTTISKLVEKIEPFDTLEQQHINDVLRWINSGSEIFRLEKPATPPKHLVVYFVLIDPSTHELLLADHKRSRLWLPPGGHVEFNEHPKDTVLREAQEELGLDVSFLQEEPFFVTVTDIPGEERERHTDVTLWYLIEGHHDLPIQYCQHEMLGVKWFKLQDIPYEQSDPHMRRFVAKLQTQNIVA